MVFYTQNLFVKKTKKTPNRPEIVLITLFTVLLSQTTQGIKFAIFLQCLEKELRNGFHFLHADIPQSFCKLALFFLMELARYIKKKVLQLLLSSVVML